jgi:polysaccharide deacetylase 2 family uncharacterized protein YibQ
MTLISYPARLRAALLALLWALPITQPASADPGYTLVIIIDDIGNQMLAGTRAVELPGKVNLAILPHTPNSNQLARMAVAAGKEVILHAPMSNTQGKTLGPGALTVGMTEQQIRRTLADNIDSTPYVRGVSNHMGSELTSQREPMEWVMEELSERGLYYIDSRTTAATLGATVAAERGIPHLSRHVFLDNEITTEAIDASFHRLLQRAQTDGMAVAIGHPYPETLDYLQQALPALEASGYRLALISEVLAEERQLSQATTVRGGTDNAGKNAAPTEPDGRTR